MSNSHPLSQLNDSKEKEQLSFGYSYETIPDYGSKVPVFKRDVEENDEEVIIDGDFEREKGLGWFIAGLISKCFCTFCNLISQLSANLRVVESLRYQRLWSKHVSFRLLNVGPHF